MKRIAQVLIGFLVSVTGVSFGQSFQDIKVSIQGTDIVVNYELGEFEYGQKYEVYLFGSHNDFKEPLQFVTGDVGRNVEGNGQRKKIVWDAKKELGNYKGYVSLELRGKPYVPFLTFKNIDDNSSFKRGKSYIIEWEGAENAGQIDLDLIKDGEVMNTIENVSNRQAFNLEIDNQLKTGKNYQIKISNSTNENEWSISEQFSIKPKIPHWLKVAPVLVIGGVVYLVTQGDGGGGNGNGPEQPSDSLPNPPLPD